MMQFGTVAFPKNPRTLKVTGERKYRFFTTPDGEQISYQCLVDTPRRVVEGTLELGGSDPNGSFVSLYSLCNIQKEGLLTLPDGLSFTAALTKMGKEESATDRTVVVSFSFIEIL